MSPFREVPRDPTIAMQQRAELLAQPLEFFRQFFDGRVPTLQEKLTWIEEAVARTTPARTFVNDTYLVEVGQAPPFIRLSIRRFDGQPCKAWADLQQIKNEIVGPEFEAAELFPAESRLVDTCNQYHLWVHPDPRYRFPFGFVGKRVKLDQSLALQCA